MKKLFYDEHPEKMISLIREQLKDGWTTLEVEQYFGNLGYDYFIVRNRIKEAKANS